MLHAGYQWNGAAVPPTAHWDKPLVGVELYDHRGGAEHMKDFDSFDVRNVADEPGLQPVRAQLRAALLAQFKGE